MPSSRRPTFLIFTSFFILFSDGVRAAIPEQIEPFLTRSQFVLQQDPNCRLALIDSMNEHELASGKRLRPLVLFLVGGFLGIAPEKLLGLARAVEWIHVGSLIHDDILDNAKTRRGLPTFLERRARLNAAILSGDYVIVESIKQITSVSSDLVPPFLDFVQALPRGEMKQHELIQANYYTEADWQFIARHKTGALFAWSFLSPFLFANTDRSLQIEAGEIGFQFGEIFQLWDDVGDCKKESEVGGVNYIFLRASQTLGITPFTNVIGTPAFSTAYQEATEKFSGRLQDLRGRIERIYRQSRRFSAGRNHQFAEASLNHMLELLDMLESTLGLSL